MSKAADLVAAATLVLSVALVTDCASMTKRAEPDSKATASWEATSSALTLRMPGARPEQDDSYFCTAFRLRTMLNSSEAIYVTQFKAVGADADRVHHLMLFSCEMANSDGRIYDCRHHQVQL
jgi:hypothetical protein